MRKFVALAIALGLVGGIAPGAAEAKARKVGTQLSVDIFGVIDRHGAVTYAFGGEVGAAGLTFKCMEGRQVTLFRLEPTGSAMPVASAKSELLGFFTGNLERPLAQVPGYYYAEVQARKRKSPNGKLKCLAARSPTILVEVPAALLSS
jgi:hypothetical protein